MQETQLYPRAISWKISVTPLGKYRPQTFSPDISRVHCPPNLPPLLFPTSTGNLNFNLTTSDGLDPAGGARLNFKWEVSPGQRPRDKAGVHHRSPPPFFSNRPIERRRCDPTRRIYNSWLEDRTLDV